MHNTSRVVLKNACQFKDPPLAYIAAKTTKLEHLKLYAANLVSDAAWRSFFLARGQTLKSIELDWLDASFDDDTVASLISSCPNLERLKLRRCRKLTPTALEHISTATNLKHLSLQISYEVPSDTLIALVESLGHNLQTLSLPNFAGTDADALNGCSDDLLSTIHTHCRKLEKLRLSGTDACSDAAFAELFANWANTELKVVDLSTTRDVDNSNPNGPEEAMGLAAQGFAALMQHSAARIEKLNIASCRHIPHSTLLDVFSPLHQTYPELREIDLSFCGAVDTVVVAGIFKTCPKLQRLIAFGCFGVEDVVVPRGILLIGAPKAQDEIVQVGNAGVSVDLALGGMLVEGAAA